MKEKNQLFQIKPFQNITINDIVNIYGIYFEFQKEKVLYKKLMKTYKYYGGKTVFDDRN